MEEKDLEMPVLNSDLGIKNEENLNVSEPKGIDNLTVPQTEEDLNEDTDTFETEEQEENEGE
ncbi:MAG: hypothetical protein OSJ63_05510 [Bacilli bacterium]|nr:hypothetical protein [Bacilli bacterium]